MVSDPGGITPASDRPWWQQPPTGDRPKKGRSPRREKQESEQQEENADLAGASGEEEDSADPRRGRVIDFEA